MALTIEPCYNDSGENLHDWVSDNGMIRFKCGADVLRVQAAYNDYEDGSENYEFATEIDKEEAIKLARAILVELNAL